MQLVSLISCALICHPSFELIEEPELAASAAHPEVLMLAETNGYKLIAEDGEIWRHSSDGRRTRIRCTAEEGSGIIHSLARDPSGATFVAAARGIFLIEDNLDLMAPIRILRDPPPGIPLWLYLDNRRRLWVLTDEAFACVSIALRTSRTMLRGSGLPDEPWKGMRRTSDGEFVLLGSSNERSWRYRPDQGPDPTLQISEVNGRRYVSGSEITVSSHQDVRIAVAASEGISCFVWPGTHGRYSARATGKQALIRNLDPGQRRIPIVAVDQDMNQSEPIYLTINVELPEMYKPRRTVPIAIGAVTIVIGAFWLFGLRRGKNVRRRYFVSAVLILLILPQVIAIFDPHVRGWPFIGFGMYTKVRERGDLAIATAIELICADGTTVVLGPLETLECFGCLSSQIRKPLLRNPTDVGAAVIAEYSRSAGHDGVIAVRIKDYRYQLNQDSPERLPSLTRMYYQESKHDF